MTANLDSSLTADVLCTGKSKSHLNAAQGSAEKQVCSSSRHYVHTLYAPPGATIQLEGLQKQLMLAIRPALTLLCDSIRLSRLR